MQLRRSRSRCVSIGKASRRFFRYRTRGSWSRARRAVAKAERLPCGVRFVVTSLSRERAGCGSSTKISIARAGRTESRNGSLFIDRTSTATLRANAPLFCDSRRRQGPFNPPLLSP